MTERRAEDAERELVEWKKVRFMKDKVGELFNGFVTGVMPFGLFVELEEFFVEGLVHISTLADDYYLFSEKTHALRGESTGKMFRLGDRLEVRVARVDVETRQIDLAVEDAIVRNALSSAIITKRRKGKEKNLDKDKRKGQRRALRRKRKRF